MKLLSKTTRNLKLNPQGMKSIFTIFLNLRKIDILRLVS